MSSRVALFVRDRCLDGSVSLIDIVMFLYTVPVKARACPEFFIGANTEGRWPRAELEFFGEEQQASPHQLGGLEERYELPSGVRGRSPTAQRFPLFSALRMVSPGTIILIVDCHATIGGTSVRPWVKSKDLDAFCDSRQ